MASGRKAAGPARVLISGRIKDFTKARFTTASHMDLVN